MPFPSKVYHRRLAALDETSFQMGNLKNVPQPKDVISQCKYEAKRNSRVDDSNIVSLQELKSSYERDLSAKIIPGFVQFPHTVPILCTTDCSFPILKSVVSTSSKESLE